jgi:hypothetical protein
MAKLALLAVLSLLLGCDHPNTRTDCGVKSAGDFSCGTVAAKPQPPAP